MFHSGCVVSSTPASEWSNLYVVSLFIYILIYIKELIDNLIKYEQMLLFKITLIYLSAAFVYFNRSNYGINWELYKVNALPQPLEVSSFGLFAIATRKIFQLELFT